jgi:glucose-6-phosphate isomerase
LHAALRAPKDKVFNVGGVNVVPDVHVVLEHVKSFANSVRDGQWVGATGKPLKNFISIGIGGSCEFPWLLSSKNIR